jgi:phosphoribosylanthranilate isomerase
MKSHLLPHVVGGFFHWLRHGASSPNTGSLLQPEAMFPMFHLKVCGLTRFQDLQAVAHGGATHWGTVMVPGTPRHVSLEHLTSLAQAVATWEAQEGSHHTQGMVWTLVVQVPYSEKPLEETLGFIETELDAWFHMVSQALKTLQHVRPNTPLWLQCHGLYEFACMCQQHPNTEKGHALWERTITRFHQLRKETPMADLLPWSLALCYTGALAPSLDSWRTWHQWHTSSTSAGTLPFFVPTDTAMTPLQAVSSYAPSAYLLDLPKRGPLSLQEALPLVKPYLLPDGQRGCPIWLAGKLSPEVYPWVKATLSGYDSPNGWDIASGVEYHSENIPEGIPQGAKSPEKLQAWFEGFMTNP